MAVRVRPRLPKMNKKLYIELPLLLFLPLIWSLLLFQYWSWDYGLHYVSAINISDKYIIYKDFFDNKGPFFYFYINILSKLIGIGVIQSYMTLYFIVLSFFGVNYFICKKTSTKNHLLIIFLLSSILFMQNINLAMRLFHTTIMILSFFFLLEGFKYKNYIYILFSFVFLSLSILTEIDGLIYIPVFLLALFFMYLNKEINFKKFIYYLITKVIIIIIIFLLFSYYFKFTLSEFIFHNIEFNAKVSSGSRDPFLEIFDDPTHIYLLMITGIGVIFIEILTNIINQNFNKISKIKNKDNQIFLITHFIIIIGTFFWLMTGSAKNYHVFIIFNPLIFYICYHLKYLNAHFIKIIFFYLLVIFFTLITLYPDSFRVLKNKCWNLDNYCGIMENSKKTIEDLKNFDGIPYIVGDDGWLYIFSNKKPINSIANHYIYFQEVINNNPIYMPTPDYLNDEYEFLINQKSNYVYWMDKDFVNRLKNKGSLISSPKIEYLIENSIIIEDQGRYLKLKIK